MRELVRASALLNFADLVEELGGDPGTLLGAVGLRPDVVGTADAFIPLRTVSQLLERAADDLGRPDFGLRLSAKQRIEILGPVALVAHYSPTAAVAIRGIARYLPSYSPALKIRLTDLDAGRSRFSFEVNAAMPTKVQILELGIGVSLGLFRLLVGSAFRPLEVAFPHAAASDLPTYRAFFGSRVRCDAEYCGFELSAIDLDRARPHSNEELRQVVARYLEATTTLSEDDVASTVRELITRMLPTGQAVCSNVAAHLSISSRTLQRWLATEETTFETLLDEVRRERARHYLAHSRLSLGQIATILGYSHQSCLSRSCIRWFDTSPRLLRHATRG